MVSRIPEVSGESFQIERRGDVAVITPSAEIENMAENLIEQAAQIVLAPLKEKPPGGLIVDSNNSLTGIHFPKVVYVTGRINLATLPQMPTLNMPALTSIGGEFTIKAAPAAHPYAVRTPASTARAWPC